MRLETKSWPLPSHKLIEAVTLRKKDGVEATRSFDDYEVAIHRDPIPDGIEVIA